MSVQGYPLHWPPGFPRATKREKSLFKTTLPGALRNVKDSLHRLAADSGQKLYLIAISSNVSLGMDKPSDPGVAVWFTWNNLTCCIPVDRYLRVEDNLQAIHHIIEARRVELRHGSLHLVQASFQGFKQLPPPNEPWHEVLGCDPDAPDTEVLLAYQRARKKHHPDHGGDPDAFQRVCEAWDNYRAWKG